MDIWLVYREMEGSYLVVGTGKFEFLGMKSTNRTSEAKNAVARQALFGTWIFISSSAKRVSHG